jgi:glycosyltransferase involved in cell wall biosynthesis
LPPSYPQRAKENGSVRYYDFMVNQLDFPNVKKKERIFVVIPSFRTRAKIVNVIASIGSEVSGIIVVDDLCPELSGQHVIQNTKDERVKVIFNESNLGVGGSTIRGYQEALKRGAEVVVKLDGDGQMNPSRIREIVAPILSGQADYVKGNRFWSIAHVKQMPKVRLIGNMALSFFAKASTGYWNLFDPNNGYTAISSNALRALPLEQIDRRYFFESDMLFHLNLMGARVEQVSMEAIYDDEQSSLKVYKIFFEFLCKHLRNTFKRIGYTYFLRDFSFASINLVFGGSLLIFSMIRGLSAWVMNGKNGVPTELGTQFLVAITFISGLQMFLSFINEDVHRAKNL